MILDIPTGPLFTALIQNREKRLILYEGSSRSGKTFAIGQYLVDECLNKPGTVVGCFRYDYTTFKDTLVPDFLKIMGREEDDDGNHLFGMNILGTLVKYKKGPHEFNFWNGSKIYFKEAKVPQKLQGAATDIAFFNEVMEMAKDCYDQVAMRCRRQLILDWNPSLPKHWCYPFIKRKDAFYMHSTFRMNPFLTLEQIREIEALEPTEVNIRNGTANEGRWRVYGLGERAILEGAIYTNWRQAPYWPDLSVCKWRIYTNDWGFADDPTGLMEVRFHQNELWCRELCYETGLINLKVQNNSGVRSLQEVLEEEQVDKQDEIIADCANPQNIKELALLGYHIIPCEKGPDSITKGIDQVKKFRINVWESENLEDELVQYVWAKKANGETTGKPIDKFNHLLDGLRYGVWHKTRFQDAKKGRGHRAKPARAAKRRRF